MSDQYVKLEEQRQHHQRMDKDKKRKKKEKGKRRHSSLPTESDEDIAPAQCVDIVTEEMPEVSPCPALSALVAAGLSVSLRGWRQETDSF